MSRRSLIVGCALALMTLVVYARSCANGFVSLDDDVYVLANPHVQEGLSLEAIDWAFTTWHASNWHPLTWLSLQLDYQLYGLAPWGYHLTNLLLHTANVVLLFWVLVRMTGALWRSAVVAACFALHPLHVESVAWIAERKDVLSTLFWLLTLGAYFHYTERPGLARYLVAMVMLALGLMAKPMLVTLPFVLLLLDYWPLKRTVGSGQWAVGSKEEEGRGQRAEVGERAGASQPSRYFSLVLEKVPLFLLAAVSSVITVVAQRAAGSVRTLEYIPLSSRCLNAMLAWVVYLRKTVWPTDLAVFYPYPRSSWLTWEAAGSAALLLAITLFAYRQRRPRPYLIVGWLWYLGTLVPVIGLLQVGDQALADRYTYVPLMGLFIALVWGLADLLAASPYRVPALPAAAMAALVAWAALTWIQLDFWHDGFRLWQHTLDVTEKNYLAHNNLGVDYLRRGEPGDLPAAAGHFSAAAEIRPDYVRAQANLGNALSQLGHFDSAIIHFRKALELDPSLDWIHFLLGSIFERQGRFEEAAREDSDGLRLNPSSVRLHEGLGRVLVRQGKLKEADEQFAAALLLAPYLAEGYANRAGVRALLGDSKLAVTFYRRAISIAPREARYHCDLALVLGQQGETEAARDEYREASRLDPGWPSNFRQAAWFLATNPNAGLRNGPRAVELAREACQANEHPAAEYLDALAAAYAEVGRFDEAATTARRAAELASSAGQGEQAKRIRGRLRLYEERRPYRAS
jgi:tetratricopeptide (TPR) repeat protein